MGGTDAAGELLRGVGVTQHEHPLGGGRLHVAHGIIAHDTVFLDEPDQGGTHAAPVLWGVGLLLHLLLYIIR